MAVGQRAKVDDQAVSSSDPEPQSLNIERLVRHTGSGSFTHEIYRRLIEQPVPLTRKNLADRLLQEQQIGTLCFRERRWRSRSEDELANDQATESWPKISGKRFLEAIQADVLPGAPKLREEKQGPSSESPPENWALLRQLLPHYRECLRLAGSSRLSQHVDRHRQQFELLRPRGRW